ncbi:MAG: hypothetical protein ACPGXZ_01175 [Saprospiraceae bacterium]
MYILKDFFNDRYLRVNADVKGKRGNTHKDYIIEIGNIIKNYSDKNRSKKLKDVRDIKSYLTELMSLRLEADYLDIEILKEKADKAYQYAKDIHRIIKEHLKE